MIFGLVFTRTSLTTTLREEYIFMLLDLDKEYCIYVETIKFTSQLALNFSAIRVQIHRFFPNLSLKVK